MRIDPAQVEHIARLARLALTRTERELLGSQLSDILTYVEKLSGVDTREVAPTSHVLELSNVFREDALRPCLSVDEALFNAPDRAGDFYRVPKIIE